MFSNETSPRDGVELAGGVAQTTGVDDGDVTRRFILFAVVELEAGGSGQSRWLQGRRYLYVPGFADE